MSTAVNLFKITFDSLSNSTYSAVKQVEKDSSYFARSDVNYKLIKINLNKNLLSLHNQIRALIFPPYQLPIINNKEIIKSKLFDDHIILTDINHNEHIYK